MEKWIGAENVVMCKIDIVHISTFSGNLSMYLRVDYLSIFQAYDLI